MTAFNHHHRQFLQYLRHGEWVHSKTLPSAPKTRQQLLENGWMERRSIEGRLSLRITEAGLAEMKKTALLASR